MSSIRWAELCEGMKVAGFDYLVSSATNFVEAASLFVMYNTTPFIACVVCDGVQSLRHQILILYLTWES